MKKFKYFILILCFGTILSIFNICLAATNEQQTNNLIMKNIEDFTNNKINENIFIDNEENKEFIFKICFCAFLNLLYAKNNNILDCSKIFNSETIDIKQYTNKILEINKESAKIIKQELCKELINNYVENGNQNEKLLRNCDIFMKDLDFNKYLNIKNSNEQEQLLKNFKLYAKNFLDSMNEIIENLSYQKLNIKFMFDFLKGLTKEKVDDVVNKLTIYDFLIFVVLFDNAYKITVK